MTQTITIFAIIAISATFYVACVADLINVYKREESK